ncbi:DLW-39 family protein [Changpingibacter yushuensis]|nr:DLW-39 family protein [Changpingibacter yushuensis]
MKKFLLAVIAVVTGYAVILEVQKNSQDRAIWHKVTDPIA